MKKYDDSLFYDSLLYIFFSLLLFPHISITYTAQISHFSDAIRGEIKLFSRWLFSFYDFKPFLLLARTANRNAETETTHKKYYYSFVYLNLYMPESFCFFLRLLRLVRIFFIYLCHSRKKGPGTTIRHIPSLFKWLSIFHGRNEIRNARR